MTGQETLIWTIKVYCDQKYIHATFLPPKSVRLKVWITLKSVLSRFTSVRRVHPRMDAEAAIQKCNSRTVE